MSTAGPRTTVPFILKNQSSVVAVDVLMRNGVTVIEGQKLYAM